MIERFIDLWDLYERHNVVCITTNGYVKRDGRAVMGVGTARQAVKRFPELPSMLGNLLQIHGNQVFELIKDRLISFPVKPKDSVSDGKNAVWRYRHIFCKGNAIPGWAMIADLCIIERSLRQLDLCRHTMNWEKVYLPRPGCGAGELDWERQVKPLCREWGDWLVVIDRPRSGVTVPEVLE